jgi:hypothetical protein
MCDLQNLRNSQGHPTLGFVRAREIRRLEIEQDPDPDWTEQQLSRLRQFPLWGDAPASELEKIPFKFRYRYLCEHPDCSSHRMTCTDWEMGQAFRQRFENEMATENDTHFFVGTNYQYPNAWIIVGLWYPRRNPQRRLF